MSLDANEFGPRHRVVEPDAWHDTLADLRDDGYTYFDWLSAVDEEADGVSAVDPRNRLLPSGPGETCSPGGLREIT